MKSAFSILLMVRGTRTGGLTEFFPTAHIRDTFLESRDHHFHALGDSFAVLTADGGGTARSGLRKNHLPGAAFAHRAADISRSEEHTSELQSPRHLVCRLLLEKNT